MSRRWFGNSMPIAFGPERRRRGPIPPHRAGDVVGEPDHPRGLDAERRFEFVQGDHRPPAYVDDLALDPEIVEDAFEEPRVLLECVLRSLPATDSSAGQHRDRRHDPLPRGFAGRRRAAGRPTGGRGARGRGALLPWTRLECEGRERRRELATSSDPWRLGQEVARGAIGGRAARRRWPARGPWAAPPTAQRPLCGEKSVDDRPMTPCRAPHGPRLLRRRNAPGLGAGRPPGHRARLLSGRPPVPGARGGGEPERRRRAKGRARPPPIARPEECGVGRCDRVADHSAEHGSEGQLPGAGAGTPAPPRRSRQPEGPGFQARRPSPLGQQGSSPRRREYQTPPRPSQ